MRIFFLFLLSHALPPADAKRRLKVLVSVPGLGYSHLALPGRLADLLVDAGHEVVSEEWKKFKLWIRKTNCVA